ncbi:hypothetical protein Taro_037419 [Colocasia esculenta]|uniref:Uncharacterized protein n=1 Tax=Colocasia esculenta TaxID=4460 RepID=A0A843WJ81_COLES|nr:hypothetical protein [Colocasia esculenta]
MQVFRMGAKAARRWRRLGKEAGLPKTVGMGAWGESRRASSIRVEKDMIFPDASHSHGCWMSLLPTEAPDGSETALHLHFLLLVFLWIVPFFPLRLVGERRIDAPEAFDAPSALAFPIPDLNGITRWLPRAEGCRDLRWKFPIFVLSAVALTRGRLDPLVHVIPFFGNRRPLSISSFPPFPPLSFSPKLDTTRKNRSSISRRSLPPLPASPPSSLFLLLPPSHPLPAIALPEEPPAAIASFLPPLPRPLPFLILP